jgi:phosphatidylinositol glycan class B
MHVFARSVETASVAETRRVRWAFLFLFLVGAVLRGIACFETLGFSHPDEHQQFLEQAQRMVYGYGYRYWEQERGMRHLLYPALLAVPLAGLDAVGIRDPMLQGSLLRLMASLFALAAGALFAWQFFRRGDAAAAFVLMYIFTLMPDLVHSHIHPISEVAATIPFLLALCWIDRRPFVAGILLGLAFGVRFQMGFLIAATLVLLFFQQRCRVDRPMARLASGLAIVLFGLGLSDRIIYAEWFHSPLEYVRANLLEGGANGWGVEPWYQYFLWLGHGGWEVIAPLAVLLVLGLRREWRFGLLAAAFLLPHMIVLHKEARFMLPIAPLMLALIATGISAICNQMKRSLRWAALGVAVAGLSVIAVIRLPQIPWNIEVYGATARLLRVAAHCEDLTGVIILGPMSAECANYFYFRRNVPLEVVPHVNVGSPLENQLFRDGKLNYLICRLEHIERFGRFGPARIAESGKFALYRLDSLPAR